MTERQKLIEQRQHAKHMMMMTRPTKGYLGSTYHSWEDKWNKARKKLEELRQQNIKKRKHESLHSKVS